MSVEIRGPAARALRRDPHRRRARLRRRAARALRAHPPGPPAPPRRAPGAVRRRRDADFLDETREVRDGDWRVAPPPADLEDRRVEITGPDQRKMVINALNSGARGFMADFEDSNSPTWANMIGGHVNLADAIARTIEFDVARRQGVPARRRGRHAAGPPARLAPARAPPAGRRRPIAGALCDFGFYFFHNARALLERGSGPYFYLPKLESHLEARLWNDVFEFAAGRLGIDHGTIKATVLIETLPAAFEMDEILYELRDHSAGLNAGRWDYMFSAIKCFRERPEFVLPDRNSVTMTAPFMRAYTELLVKTCHRRGAHAIGGMAAFDPEPHRRGGQREGDGKAARGQEPRGRRRLRRHLGRAPRHGRGGDGGVRRGARRPSQPGRPPARGGLGLGGRPARHAVDARARSRSRDCAATSTSASSTSPRGCAATAPPASTG